MEATKEKEMREQAFINSLREKGGDEGAEFAKELIKLPHDELRIYGLVFALDSAFDLSVEEVKLLDSLVRFMSQKSPLVMRIFSDIVIDAAASVLKKKMQDKKDK